MEQTDKDKMRASASTHTFPTIRPDSQDPDRSDDCFRPLFQGAQDDLNSSANPPCVTKDGQKENNPLAVALKESFERGVEDGNKEACSLAQKALEPSMDGFYDSLNAFSENYARFTREYASQIVALALAVAGKIAKGQLAISSAELLPIQEAIKEMLQHHHQLNLQLNGQDLKDLADLMRCRNIEMNDIGAIRICDNDAVQRGTPQPSNHSVPSIEALAERITQLLEELPGELQSKKASTS